MMSETDVGGLRARGMNCTQKEGKEIAFLDLFLRSLLFYEWITSRQSAKLLQDFFLHRQSNDDESWTEDRVNGEGSIFRAMLFPLPERELNTNTRVRREVDAHRSAFFSAAIFLRFNYCMYIMLETVERPA